MRCLSLTQPWASLVSLGKKQIETRNWNTNYRGPLLIHAAAGLGPVGGETGLRELCRNNDHFYAALRDSITSIHGGPMEPADTLPRGVIVAVCDLVDCRYTAVAQGGRVHEAAWLTKISEQERAFGDYSPDRYGWILENIRAFREPIPCRGALGLWAPPADVLQRVDTPEAQEEGVLL